MILFDGVHLASTTSLIDLNDVASRIGLDPEWIHMSEKHPHYDILPGIMMARVEGMIDRGEIERCSSRDLVIRCFRGGRR